ncbi:hypothetical protein MC885_020691, partial [Smutsia gigantea]
LQKAQRSGRPWLQNSGATAPPTASFQKQLTLHGGEGPVVWLQPEGRENRTGPVAGGVKAGLDGMGSDLCIKPSGAEHKETKLPNYLMSQLCSVSRRLSTTLKPHPQLTVWLKPQDEQRCPQELVHFSREEAGIGLELKRDYSKLF